MFKLWVFFETSSNCYFSIKYWRNWWHVFDHKLLLHWRIKSNSIRRSNYSLKFDTYLLKIPNDNLLTNSGSQKTTVSTCWEIVFQKSLKCIICCLVFVVQCSYCKCNSAYSLSSQSDKLLRENQVLMFFWQI